MRIKDRGSSRKGGKYLVCSAAEVSLGCVRIGWRYDHFETSFLRFVEQLNLPKLFDDDDTEKIRLEKTLEAIRGHKTVVEQQMELTYRLLQEADIPFIARKFTELEQQLHQLEAQQKQTTAALESREFTRDAFYQANEEVRPLIKRLQDKTAKREDLYRLRSQVADQIKAIAADVEVATEGAGPLLEGRIGYTNPKRADSSRHGMFAEQRFFVVTFKDLSTLGVIPPDDPLDVDHYQFFTTGDPWSVT
jgi:hypothetical protein